MFCCEEIIINYIFILNNWQKVLLVNQRDSIRGPAGCEPVTLPIGLPVTHDGVAGDVHESASSFAQSCERHHRANMETDMIYTYDDNGNLKCETMFTLQFNRFRIMLRNNSDKTYVMVQCQDDVITLDSEQWLLFIKYLPTINTEFNSRFNTEGVNLDRDENKTNNSPTSNDDDIIFDSINVDGN